MIRITGTRAPWAVAPAALGNIGLPGGWRKLLCRLDYRVLVLAARFVSLL